MSLSSFLLHPSSLWLFYLCMALGLFLHVLLKIDAWWKPEWANNSDSNEVRWRNYFTQNPFRTLISLVSTLLLGLLMWEYGVRDAIAAGAAGYMGNSILHNLLGSRKDS